MGKSKSKCHVGTKVDKNTYLCCKKAVTNYAHNDCTSGKNNIDDTTLGSYYCVNAGWFTSSGAFDTGAFCNSMSAYTVKKVCTTSCIVAPVCVSYSLTDCVYVSCEPLEEPTMRVFKYAKNPCTEGYSKQYINYPLPQFSLFAYIKDYNIQSLMDGPNVYMESEGGTGYCTGIANKTGLKLQTASAAFYTNHISILSTIICWKLQQEPFTTNIKDFRSRIYLNTAPFFKTYFVNYLKQPVDKTKIREYGILLWYNYFTDTGNYNIYLRKLDSMIIFIYNILITAAKEQEIAIGENFAGKFFELMFKQFVPTLALTTGQVNNAFRDIVPKLLLKNHNSIFSGWFDSISTSTNVGFYIAAQYAPLYKSYEELSQDNYEQQVASYVDLPKVVKFYNYYKEQAINGYEKSKYLQPINVLPKETQARIIKKISEIMARAKYDPANPTKDTKALFEAFGCSSCGKNKAK